MPIRPRRLPIRKPHFDIYERNGVSFLSSDYVPNPDEVGAEFFDSLLRIVEGLSKARLERVVRSQRNVREYLRDGHPFRPWKGYVLAHGREYFADDPGDSWRVGKEWLCYENAMELAKRDRRVAYAEGLCLSPFGAHLHAWNVRRDKVIDLTWPCAHLNRYFGITFDTTWLLDHNYIHGCVFGHWDPVHQYLAQRASRS